MSNKQTSIKSKLFKLKKWLTIPETAKHLSIMFGEEVQEADVLRLGLDRHLKLSVNFVNHVERICPGYNLPEELAKNVRGAIFDRQKSELEKKV